MLEFQCLNQFRRSVGGGSRILSTSRKYVNFLQNLGMISLFAVRFVSGTARNRNEHSFKISYLINSCGFSPESALSVSKKVHFENSQQPDSVISFFKDHGFSQTQIRKIIKQSPEFLLYNPEKTLLPKLQFFYSKRISSFDLVRVLSLNSDALRRGLHTCIIPNFNSFKDFTGCDDTKVLLAYKHCSDILGRNFQSVFGPNLAILREYGVSESNIKTKLVDHPRVFAVNPDKFRRTVEEVKKLGFEPSKHNFLEALRALLQLSKSTWEKKFNVLKQWGWSDGEILSAFEKYPVCMMLSEDKITATMNFFVNTMGWKSSCVANCPLLLTFSLGKRIIPRCSVLQALLSKGLIEKFSVYLLLQSTEKEFLQKFVTRYEDPYLLKLYEEKLGLPE